MDQLILEYDYFTTHYIHSRFLKPLFRHSAMLLPDQLTDSSLI